jgi:hypothetical protein
VVQPRDLVQLRGAIRDLTIRGQPRVHFRKESDSRRKLILSELRRTGVVQVLVYDASNWRDTSAPRDAVLERLVEDLGRTGAHRLVLEADDSVTASDRKTIRERARKVGCPNLAYEHVRGHEVSAVSEDVFVRHGLRH